MLEEFYYRQARQRYNHCVMQAQLTDLWGRMTGHRTDLVRFQDVAQRLGARQQVPRGIHAVPLDRIVGSVGRPRDFTGRFLPRPSVNQERWAGIDAALNAQVGLPPVELYRVGEVYFVKDGHHRISVARANSQIDIEAVVIEVQSPMKLTVDDFQWKRRKERAKQAGREEAVLEMVELEVIKSEQAELRRQFAIERNLPRKGVRGAGVTARLLDRMGDRLIAFGTQLKAIYRPIQQAAEIGTTQGGGHHD